MLMNPPSFFLFDQFLFSPFRFRDTLSYLYQFISSAYTYDICICLYIAYITYTYI